MQRQMEQMLFTTSRFALTSTTNDQRTNPAFREIGNALRPYNTTNASFVDTAYLHGDEVPTFPDNTAGIVPTCYKHPDMFCGSGCSGCRRRKALVSVIPTMLSSILGRLYVPRGIRSISPQPCTQLQCDDPTCKRHHNDLTTLRFYFPDWFNQISAELRVENQSTIHFALWMPRVVEQGDLRWLEFATWDEVKQKLRSRELTVNDVHPNGQSVLHVSAPLLNKYLIIYLHLVVDLGSQVDCGSVGNRIADLGSRD